MYFSTKYVVGGTMGVNQVIFSNVLTIVVVIGLILWHFDALTFSLISTMGHGI